MADAKIEVKVGQFSFAGEGTQDWLAQQLDKILGKAEKIAELSEKVSKVSASAGSQDNSGHKAADFSSSGDIGKKTLPAFLKDANATSKQVDKFLAASIWIEAKGKARITTADVTSALKTANQSRLSNPADCLAKNINKGFCERDGKDFFVTEDGKKSLGL
jgi:hypothetical protein